MSAGPGATQLRLAGFSVLVLGELPEWLLPFAGTEPVGPERPWHLTLRPAPRRDGMPGLVTPRWRPEGGRLHYQGRSARGVIDWDEGTLHVESPPLRAPLVGFLRTWLALALPREGGLLLHGAAAARDEAGYLFLGASGAGKTTIANLAAASGATVLGDEVVALRLGPAGGQLHGTPLGSRGGPAGSPGPAQARALCLLRQAPAAAYRPLRADALLAALLARTLAPPALIEAAVLLRSASALANGCPGGELSFRRAADFWDVLPGR